MEADFHLHLHLLLKSSCDCASTVAAAAGACASTVVSVCESRPTSAGLLCDSPVGVAWRSGAQWPCSSRGRALGLNLPSSTSLEVRSLFHSSRGNKYHRTPLCKDSCIREACTTLWNSKSIRWLHRAGSLLLFDMPSSNLFNCAVLVKSRVMWRRDSDGMEQLDA